MHAGDVGFRFGAAWLVRKPKPYRACRAPGAEMKTRASPSSRGTHDPATKTLSQESQRQRLPAALALPACPERQHSHRHHCHQHQRQHAIRTTAFAITSTISTGAGIIVSVFFTSKMLSMAMVSTSRSRKPKQRQTASLSRPKPYKPCSAQMKPESPQPLLRKLFMVKPSSRRSSTLQAFEPTKTQAREKVKRKRRTKLRTIRCLRPASNADKHASLNPYL